MHTKGIQKTVYKKRVRCMYLYIFFQQLIDKFFNTNRNTSLNLTFYFVDGSLYYKYSALFCLYVFGLLSYFMFSRVLVIPKEVVQSPHLLCTRQKSPSSTVLKPQSEKHEYYYDMFDQKFLLIQNILLYSNNIFIFVIPSHFFFFRYIESFRRESVFVNNDYYLNKIHLSVPP